MLKRIGISLVAALGLIIPTVALAGVAGLDDPTGVLSANDNQGGEDNGEEVLQEEATPAASPEADDTDNGQQDDTDPAATPGASPNTDDDQDAAEDQDEPGDVDAADEAEDDDGGEGATEDQDEAGDVDDGDAEDADDGEVADDDDGGAGAGTPPPVANPRFA
jgi:hypothetical protein